MQVGRFHLSSNQVPILSGCFSGVPTNPAFHIQGNGSLPILDPRYTTNSEEADMRIWRHATQISALKVLIYSPDSDIYNIGLPLVAMECSKEIIVQLNVPQSQLSIYLHMNNLIKALELDPDLASVQKHKLANIFQMLYICSGCDYVSHFCGQGKAVFFNVFFQHASFITGHQMCGSLADVSDDTRDKGFLSFIRLIGTLYFKKHYSAKVFLKGVETPKQLYNSHVSTNINDQHRLWYDDIRQIIGDRITKEEERMPSYTSMWRHWLRSCWVAQMWQNSSKEDLFHMLPKPESSGWKVQDDGTYTVDWECPTTQKEIEETINFLTRVAHIKLAASLIGVDAERRGTTVAQDAVVRGVKTYQSVEQQIHRSRSSYCLIQLHSQKIHPLLTAVNSLTMKKTTTAL